MKYCGIIAAMTVALLFVTGARANEGSCFKVIDVPANNGIPGMSEFELIPCDARARAIVAGDIASCLWVGCVAGVETSKRDVKTAGIE
ncbi:MAG TPA: hypothetical protein VLX09_22470 [Stellaceae bacterium]|nr:hypothetical protein [Stellaceae bacterium]